jgi:hypothetical protein
MVCGQAILFLASFALAAPAAPASRTPHVRERLMPDGVVLLGIEGKLTRADSNDDPNLSGESWLFEFESQATDETGPTEPAGRLELLPSETLERMIADAEKRAGPGLTRMPPPKTQTESSATTAYGAAYRLKARVTKYRGKNYLYPISFTPIGQMSEPPVPTDQNQPVAEGPNDTVTIPKDIMNRLKGRKIVRRPVQTGQQESVVKPKRDVTLADRIGLVTASQPRPERRWENLSLVLDSFGRNVETGKFYLLPCQARERAERRQLADPERLRFKIAGIVTEYKGTKYMLLQRITQTYSHRNFDR